MIPITLTTSAVATGRIHAKEGGQATIDQPLVVVDSDESPVDNVALDAADAQTDRRRRGRQAEDGAVDRTGERQRRRRKKQSQPQATAQLTGHAIRRLKWGHIMLTIYELVLILPAGLAVLWGKPFLGIKTGWMVALVVGLTLSVGIGTYTLLSTAVFQWARTLNDEAIVRRHILSSTFFYVTMVTTMVILRTTFIEDGLIAEDGLALIPGETYFDKVWITLAAVHVEYVRRSVADGLHVILFYNHTLSRLAPPKSS